MRKIFNYTLILLLQLCFLTGYSQTIYKTGFDTDKEKEGWTEFKLGKDGTAHWEFVKLGKDNSTCLIHYAPTGDADKDSLVNWFVSPKLDLSEGGKIDSMSFNYFCFMNTFFPEQHVGVYLLKGKGNPIEATETIKIADFTALYSGENTFWRDTGDFSLPVIFDDAFLAFKFVAIDGWASISYDNIQITQNKTSDIIEVNRNEINVYPNPSTDFIYIESKENIRSVQVYNMSGQLVLQSNNSEIYAGELKAGMYRVSIQTDKGTLSKSIKIH